MNAATARRLLELNRNFYDAFAAEFAGSRRALQPGIFRALKALGAFASIVDVGCGDGRVGRALAWPVERYVGVDFSVGLLSQTARAMPPEFTLVQRDLAASGWAADLGLFDSAVCFSALHHIPGLRRRLRLLREIRSLLKPGGRCAVSVWQFLHVPRLARKIVPWKEIGLSARDVDAGDYLIDWRRGGRGLRYVHHFEEAELIGLCRRAGFDVIETYRSDGHASGSGDLGLYVLLEAVLY